MDLIEWTFDPLEIKNAFFNIEKLGRHCAPLRSQPVRNDHQSSCTAGSQPTGSIAEWHAFAPRGRSILSGEQLSRTSHESGRDASQFLPTSRRSEAKIPKRARAIQAAIGSQFDESFAQGLAVTGFERTE